jgi:hypothetical protein
VPVPIFDSGSYYVAGERALVWMLTMYPKNVADNIPAQVLRQIRREVENG